MGGGVDNSLHVDLNSALAQIHHKWCALHYVRLISVLFFILFRFISFDSLSLSIPLYIEFLLLSSLCLTFIY